ncbi:MAG TPA: class I SAM-dependent methyltransferase [Xanthobacteraceae bacterium]|jgi:S-adenosylmethionine-diacylgycerolhomoserine-N-methlytransferase
MADAAIRMDRQYRWQRHIYDLTRMPYLLGRDRLIAELRPPSGAAVLEIGCGTGRNLIRIARTCPDVACFGIDVSSVMLDTARRSIAAAGLESRITLAQADAVTADPAALFGRASFERVMISYALSMIPPWRQALAHAVSLLGPQGALCLVDFGDQAGMPAWFRVLLFRWLAWFHVSPRLDLRRELAQLAHTADLQLRVCDLYRGYACFARLERVGAPLVGARRNRRP